MGFGTLYLVVGPSGSGKQALVDAVLESRPDIQRAPLIVATRNTRNMYSVGAVSLERFLDLMNRGTFALQWDADGVRYGLTFEATKQLQDGHSLILCCDMLVVEKARALFPHVRVVYITARMDILRRRLASMAYGSDAEIDMHLAQAARLRPKDCDVFTVDTSDSIVAGARMLMDSLPVA